MAKLIVYDHMGHTVEMELGNEGHAIMIKQHKCTNGLMTEPHLLRYNGIQDRLI